MSKPTAHEIDVAFSAVEYVFIHGDLRGQQVWDDGLKALIRLWRIALNSIEGDQARPFPHVGPTLHYCPNCASDVSGNRRELMLDNGTRCHGCGYMVGDLHMEDDEAVRLELSL